MLQVKFLLHSSSLRPPPYSVRPNFALLKKRLSSFSIHQVHLRCGFSSFFENTGHFRVRNRFKVAQFDRLFGQMSQIPTDKTFGRARYVAFSFCHFVAIRRIFLRLSPVLVTEYLIDYFVKLIQTNIFYQIYIPQRYHLIINLPIPTRGSDNQVIYPGTKRIVFHVVIFPERVRVQILAVKSIRWIMYISF